MIDDYNNFINSVEIVNQLRAKFSTEQKTSRTRMLLFYFLLDTAICNAYILSKHYRKSKSSKYVRSTH